MKTWTNMFINGIMEMKKFSILRFSEQNKRNLLEEIKIKSIKMNPSASQTRGSALRYLRPILSIGLFLLIGFLGFSAVTYVTVNGGVLSSSVTAPVNFNK